MKRLSLFLTVSVLLCVVFVSMALAASPIENITFITEEYPPFNMVGDDGKPTGLSVDILLEVFKRAGVNLSAEDIQVLPWARGLRTLDTTPGTCLFSMTRTEARENSYKWVGPLFISSFDVLALKSSGLKASSPKDLVSLRTGVVRDDISDSLATEAGIQHIERVSRHDLNIAKLKEGRIDIIIYNEGSLKQDLAAKGESADAFANIMTLLESRLHFAFNKETPDEPILEIQKALDSIIEDGTHSKILEKYGFPPMNK